jgi:hypothetical protein
MPEASRALLLTAQLRGLPSTSIDTRRSGGRDEARSNAGGQGSIQAALASGVSVIGIPLQAEQDANVALAESQGAARLVPQ